jgi:yersiniabactin nonribosomal peptide synthetase
MQLPIGPRPELADERARVIPPEILSFFDDTFVRSCHLIEEYVPRLALKMLRSTGLERACAEAATVEEAIERAGLSPAVARVPVAWLLETLAARGWVDRVTVADDVARYRVSRALPALDPDELLEAQTAHDARCLPSYRIAALAADCYPAVLRGEMSGEQALFGPEGVIAWSKYFSNANPLYGIANAIGAIAAARALPRGGGEVLELGAGFGSGAEALLERLEAAGRRSEVSRYRVTDLSPMFLRRAERTLRARFPGLPAEFRTLDIDRPFAEAEVSRGGCALVYGVNVLHVARDLAATLAEVRAALAERGVLAISECVRPFPGRPVYVEFVFNLLGSFRDPVLAPAWRPNGGFLAPEQWRSALEANGFTDVRVFPDIAAIREVFPLFVVAAIVATRA